MAEEIRASIKVKDLATRGFNLAGRGVLKFSRTAIRSIRGVNRALKRMGDSIFSVKRALQVFVGAAVVRGLASVITNVAAAGDRFAKLNQRLGISTELLSGLEFAAARSGFGFESLVKGLERAVRGMEEFRRFGRGEAKEAFEILGGGLAQAVKEGKTFEELLPRIADRFAGLRNEQERALAAQKLFGRSGLELNQLLALGSEEIRKLTDRARELGIVFSQEGADRAVAFVDALEDLKRAFQGLVRTGLTDFFPFLTQGIKDLTNFISGNRDIVIQFFKDLTVTVLRAGVAVLQTLQSLSNSLADLKSLVTTITGERSDEEKLKAQIELGARALAFFKGIDLSRGFNALTEFRKKANRAAESTFDFNSQIKTLLGLIQKLEKPSTGSDDLIGPPIPDFGAAGADPSRLLKDLAPTIGDVQKRVTSVIPSLSTLQQGFRNVGAIGARSLEKVNERIREHQEFLERTDPIEGFKAGLRDIGEEAANLGDRMRETVVTIKDLIVDNLTNAIFDFASGVKDAKQAFADFARAIAADIGRLLIRQGLNLAIGSFFPAGAGAAKGGVVPGLQAGGVVTSQRLLNTALGAVRVRERGQNEAVVPLPDNRSIPVRLQGGSQPQTTIVRQEFRFEVNTIDSAGVDKFLNDNKEKIRGLSAQGMRTDFIFNQQMRGATV